jgi:Carboxypeptidase regulatory-like domain
MARISEPVVGAKVRLAGAATAETSTAADGAFTLPELPPGQYKLTVDAGDGQASIVDRWTRYPGRDADFRLPFSKFSFDGGVCIKINSNEHFEFVSPMQIL